MELIRSSKYNKKCKKCESDFSYTSDDVFWDEKGTWYSTKLVKCTECGCINVVKYYDDYGFDVNNDSRFYDYKR